MAQAAALRAPSRRRQEEKQSLFSYCLQGGSFLGFLLFLFWLAGMQF